MSTTAKNLIWAKLTIFLLFGLLLLRNGQFLSHIHLDDDDDDEQATGIISRTSPTFHEGGRPLYSYKDPKAGLFSQMMSSLADSWRGNNKEPLCEFKGDEVLPKNLLLAKLAECYKSLRSKHEAENGIGDDGQLEGRNYIRNRRLLRSSDDRESYTGSRAYPTSTSMAFQAKATTITSRIAEDDNVEAAFHIDYSGPKTHPPKNN
ncbi:hypothetical protein GOP47_0029999 [Adiantum capillus-veneris]|nr:hypothetical protein GOP47_0029999 [Adiantum capillus-veneris]